jgi:hypothetical protein
MIKLKIIYSHALPALMGFDFAGIVLKWRMFDHFVSVHDGLKMEMMYIYIYIYIM